MKTVHAPQKQNARPNADNKLSETDTAKATMPPPLQLNALQTSPNKIAQLESMEEDMDSMQMSPFQLSAKNNQAEAHPSNSGTDRKTGLPAKLKAGVESISGLSLNDVKVHYNSDQPAQLKAHAFAQGTDIHLAPGQEKHLPHEAWHVVQQKQGRVQPTTQLKSFQINDDAGLEREADIMGEKAMNTPLATQSDQTAQLKPGSFFSGVTQFFKGIVQRVKPASKAKALEKVKESGEYYKNGKIGGGKPFYNKEKKLPKGSKKKPISYTEYDVNPYNGKKRDAERIVVGSDGKVYYTGDHYSTFSPL